MVQADAGEAGGYDVLARATAAALGDRLVAGTVLGVSDGETVAAVATALRRARSGDLDVMPLIGGIGDPHIATHSAEICRCLATNVGGRIWQLPVPAVVKTGAVARSLARIPAVSAVFDLMDRMTVGLVGIGSMTRRASIFRHSLLNCAHIEAIRQEGAVGSICGRLVDNAGEPVSTELDERTIAITTLVKAKLRMAAAAGEPKSAAIEAALRSCMINALCTDVATARSLLESHQATWRTNSEPVCVTSADRGELYPCRLTARPETGSRHPPRRPVTGADPLRGRFLAIEPVDRKRPARCQEPRLRGLYGRASAGRGLPRPQAALATGRPRFSKR